MPRSSVLFCKNDCPSPAEIFTTPVVSENEEAMVREPEIASGRKRSTGRVAWEARRIHFQSSDMSVPCDFAGGPTFTVLSMLDKLISSRLSVLGSTEMLRRSAGAKLARMTRSE